MKNNRWRAGCEAPSLRPLVHCVAPPPAHSSPASPAGATFAWSGHRPLEAPGSVEAKGPNARGFTLIELMIIVVIMGVLSSLAVVGYRRYFNEAKTSEAREIIGAIKAGQEALRDETFAYLDVSATIDTYYPNANPTGDLKTQWDSTAPGFSALGVAAGPVYFGYATKARTASGPALGVGAGVTGFGTFAAANEPQYIVKAVCDIDVGGDKTVFVSTNIQADIYGENVGR